MWTDDIDPYITVFNAQSSDFPLMLHKTGFLPSLHVGLHLPMGGREQDFSQAMADLTGLVELAIQDYPCITINLKGDANVNPANKPRVQLFQDFIPRHSLRRIDLCPNTYHHFMGGDVSMSLLDVLVHNGNKVLTSLCQ